MVILATPRQTLWNLEARRPEKTVKDRAQGDVDDGMSVADQPAKGNRKGQFDIKSCSGYHDIARALISGDDEYLVCSARSLIIWDEQLIGRIEAEVAAFNELDVPWLCLVSDGLTITGQYLTGTFFEREPLLTPDRGRRPIIQSSGTLYIFNMSSVRQMELTSLPNIEFVDIVNQLIVLGYGIGIGSFFSSAMFPCFADTRQIWYKPIEDQVAAIDTVAFSARAHAVAALPNHSSRLGQVSNWIDAVTRAAAPCHLFSFVVRTIFKRPYLLRRCLISIDYLRRSSGMQAEIVIATDVASAISKPAMEELMMEFPDLSFVLADGLSEQGYSRVRNLIAGLKATTGTRVCIIDDDDYYTPAAIEPMSATSEFGSESLIIFDTQIINERWSTDGVKPHKEILSYGGAFAARGWIYTARGSNSIPLCGVIHPGWFARRLADEYSYEYDLSEDFIFHLMCFTHPQRPPVRIVEGIGAYQSHRAADDNVSNLSDRTGWVVDLGNGLYKLLFERGFTFEVVCGSEAFNGAMSGYDRVEALTSELERMTIARDQATRLLAEAVAKLRARAPAAESTAATAPEPAPPSAEALALSRPLDPSAPGAPDNATAGNLSV